MKLFYCTECLDMKKLRMVQVRFCACGKSWGYYLEDDLTAEMGGCAVPVAIANDELREAVSRRPSEGKGSVVEARVLPHKYDTVRYRDVPNGSLTTDGGG